MIIVSGHVVLEDAAAVEKLRPAMEAQLTASRAEDGCIDYTYAVDVPDPKIIRVLEYWESWDALKVHFTQPHMAPWRDALKEAGIVSRNLQAAETALVREV